MHNGRVGRTYRVMDQGLLSEVVADTAERRFDGSLNRGVEATNKEIGRRNRRQGTTRSRTRGLVPVDYATIYRLRHGRTGQIKHSTFNWLLLFVPKEDHGRLLEAVVSPSAQELLNGCDGWLRRETGWIEGVAGSDGITGALFALRRSRTDRLLAEMRELTPKAFDRFDNLTSHHRTERVWVSLLHLVEPFVKLGEDAGIERRWKELGAEEQKGYIKASLRREEILLNRLTDIQRAQCQASEVPRFLLPPLRPKAPAGRKDGTS
jgi:hypothetical protein